MKATIENLKANRNQVIDILNAEYGNDNLVSSMTMLKNHVEFSEMFNKNESLQVVIENLIKSEPFKRNKSTKTAELLSGLAELEENRNNR